MPAVSLLAVETLPVVSTSSPGSAGAAAVAVSLAGRRTFGALRLARELDAAPDQATVQDALDAQMLDNDLSDVNTQNAASAVVRALKE